MTATETKTPAKRTRKAKAAATDASPVIQATAIHHNLLQTQPKLDKVGVRLEKALKAIMNGGAADNLPDLQKQVTDYLTNGVPEVMKSTSRRTKPDPKIKLSAVDMNAIADEANARRATADKITSCKNSVDGGYVVVSKVLSGGKEGDTFTLLKELQTKEFSAACAVGQSFSFAKKLADQLRAERAAKPGFLARGLDARNAPQSVAANQAKKAAEKKAAKPDLKAKPDPKKEARKAEKAEKAAPKAGDKRGITILKKDFAFGKEGTSRRASWDKCLKAKTVDAYLSAGGAAKYLPRWASAGAIKLG